MTAGLLAAIFGPALAAMLVAFVGWRAHRDRYPERPGRDDDHDVTPVRAPLAIEGVAYRHPDADTARILAATELPRFPFPKGGPRP